MSTEHATPLRQAESLGHVLKQAREAKGYSEEDVADALRLEKSVILRMEQDAYLAQEISVFVRGYFRAYAKYVEIPTQQVDNHFLEKGLLDIPKKVSPAKFDFTLPSNSRRTLHWTSFFIVACVIVLIVGWIYWQRSDVNNTLLPAVSSNTPTTQPAAQPQPQMAQAQPLEPSQAPLYNSTQQLAPEQSTAVAVNTPAAQPSDNTTITQSNGNTAAPAQAVSQVSSTQATATNTTTSSAQTAPTQLAMIASQPVGQ